MIPIHLSNEIMPSAIFYGTCAPLMIYYVAKRLIIDPYIKENEERYLFKHFKLDIKMLLKYFHLIREAKKKQEKLKAELIEKRRLALAAVI